MTIEQLAAASDVAPETMVRYESGMRIPVDRLWTFAKALQVSIHSFFTEDALRDHPPSAATTADVQEGLALLAAFHAIKDARLRSVLTDIAGYFAHGRLN